MSKPKTHGKGCLAAAIAILLIVALITAGVVVVLNLTPAQIGLADVPIIEQKSAQDLGVSDAKVKEIIKLILQKSVNN